MKIFPEFVIIPIIYFFISSIITFLFWFLKTKTSMSRRVASFFYRLCLYGWITILLWLYTSLGVYLTK